MVMLTRTSSAPYEAAIAPVLYFGMVRGHLYSGPCLRIFGRTTTPYF